MEATLHWIGFGAGIVLVLIALAAAIALGFGLRRPLLIRAAMRPVAALFAAVGRRMPSDLMRARLLAGRGPAAAVAALVVLWVVLIAGFGLTLLPFDGPSVSAAFRHGAAAVLGIGLLGSGVVPLVVALIGAGAGVLVLVLSIVFVLRLGSLVARGQQVIAAVEARSGVPPWGPALVAGYVEAGAAVRLPALYQVAESWAAELAPRGDPLPLWFRSAGTMVDGVTALVAVMDAAALDIALVPDNEHADARMLLRTGTDALDHARRVLGVGSPPVRAAMLTEEGFELGLERLSAAGYEHSDGNAGGWMRFVRLRRGYAPDAVAVGRRMLSPPAPWMGEWPGPASKTEDG